MDSSVARTVTDPQIGIEVTLPCLILFIASSIHTIFDATEGLTMPQTTVPVDTEGLFEQFKADWKSKSRHMSNSAQMATVWSYQQIIGMGRPALPLILRELERETDHWFWALEAISCENPVSADQAGSVEDMAKSWIKWGRQKGLL